VIIYRLKNIIFSNREFIMTIKPQASNFRTILIIVIFCIALSTPAGALENTERSVRAGAIIDQTVFNVQGQELGELEDLVIKRNGTVKKALISVGGFLEVGGKLVSVKYKSLRFVDKKIVSDITKKQLDEYPEFDYRKKDLFTTYHYRLHPYGIMPGPYGTYGREMPPGYREQWTDQPGLRPRSGSHGYGSENQPGDRSSFRHSRGDMHRMKNWYSPWGKAYFPAQMLASVVLGQTVVNKHGEEVAIVEDIIISTAGKVKDLVFSYGGFLDIGDRLVAVPYRPVGFTSRGITYDITARELENRQKFRETR
jgi:sporulation protein YlmC with PRC-barrel domain